MKTICFDLRALQIGHQNRGIGMYVRSLLEHLPKDNNHYIFYCFDKNNPIETLGIKIAVDYEIVHTPTVKTALGSPKDLLNVYRLVHHRFSSLKKLNPDIFVQFDFTLGIPNWRRTKTIVIGYDLIPLIMKQEYLPSIVYAWHHEIRRLRGVLRALYYRWKYRLHYAVYKRADLALCISKASATSFHELLGIPLSKLASIPLAPVLPHEKPSLRVVKKIDKPYVLYVGATDSRKRVCDIVHAYNIARGRGADLALALAGNEFASLDKMTDPIGRQAIQNSPYRDDIYLVGFVSDSEKLGLYQKAQAFVFASMYEGFGMPVVEAMAAGCPVVAYNNSSISEIAGSAALLAETGDIVDLARNIIKLQDGDLRQSYIDKGQRRAHMFSWNSYVDQFVELLNG